MRSTASEATANCSMNWRDRDIGWLCSSRWRLRFEYARKGAILSLLDMLIAATALERGLTLITANRKHFPMPELVIHPCTGL